MKILVAIKQVQVIEEDLEGESLPAGGGSTALDPAMLSWELNEWDNYSIEAALQLAEAAGGEVVAVTVGGEEATDGLLSCLAKGADRAIHIRSELPGSDPLATAHVLAKVAAREPADLILCGVQSSDFAQAATGVALAGLLDIAHVAVVKAISWNDGMLTVQRELEGGAIEALQLRTPALLTIQTGINEPRYATMRAIKQARAKPLDVLDLDELGVAPAEVEAAQGAHVESLSLPERSASASMLDGSPEELATRIIEIIAEAVGR